MQIGRETDRRRKDPFPVFSFTFPKELFEPFTEIEELRLITDQ
jgi:hypothetical protein